MTLSRIITKSMVRAAKRIPGLGAGLPGWAATEPRSTLQDLVERDPWAALMLALHLRNLTASERLEIADRQPSKQARYLVAATGVGLTMADRIEVIKQAGRPSDWYEYAAVHCPGITYRQRLALAQRATSPRRACHRAAVSAPGLTLAQRRCLADRTSRPRSILGQIACHTPGISMTDRLALVAESDRPELWARTLLASDKFPMTPADRFRLRRFASAA